jgi:INO80 complex subunit B
MDENGGSSRLESIGNMVRRKRSQTSRRPRPESQPLTESRDRSSLSSTPSDDASKLSSDDTNGVDPNPRRKLFNLNQCDSKSDYPNKKFRKEDVANGISYSNEAAIEQGATQVTGDELGNKNTLKKVKLKLGGVTRTIQAKSSNSTKTARATDATKPRQKLTVQGDSEEEHSPSSDKKGGLQGIPWKDFSRVGFSIQTEESSSMGKSNAKSSSERVRKSKRVPKKKVLDGAFDDDEDDDEIRYLEKIKISKLAAGSNKDFDEDSSALKHRRVSKSGGKRDSPEDLDAKRAKSEDVDYEEEQRGSDGEPGGGKKNQNSDSPPGENKREMSLTTRQRALLGKDASAAGSSSIEFPNGLPPPAPRKQKEKLTEVEQQLKKAEAAEKRRVQNEKAARESEAEAIRKILGQDSSRKKREDKLKKRQEEIAQERAANAHTITPSTVRCVMGPQGTVVTFSNDLGLPHIFHPKPSSYPPPREKCAGPSCTNIFKYRDSKSKLPLCSLQCYKAINQKIHSETAC